MTASACLMAREGQRKSEDRTASPPRGVVPDGRGPQTPPAARAASLVGCAVCFCAVRF